MNRELDRFVKAYTGQMSGEPLPVQMMGRLEDEIAAIPGTGVLDDIELMAALRKAAAEEGCTAEADLGFGSFLLTRLFGASDTDPLPPHYFCETCGRREFVPEAKDGFDLPEKCCCGQPMRRSGHRIPFEIMVPNIDEAGFPLVIRIPDSFCGRALDVIREHYGEKGEYRPVVTVIREEESEEYRCITVALIPAGEPMPEMEEDGIWRTDMQEFYRERDLRTIDIVQDEEKERLRKLAVKTGAVPTTDELLSEKVFAAAKERIETRIREEGYPLLRMEGLNFSSLLALRGYERSGYMRENPVLADPGASYADLFTCREDVWDRITAAIRPEYGIGIGLAVRITNETRRGKYTCGRMDAVTEGLLREMGISEHWIGQMQNTCYLPGKASVILSLMEDLKRTWYELREQ